MPPKGNKLQKPQKGAGQSGSSRKPIPDLSANLSNMSLLSENSQKRREKSWLLVALTVDNRMHNNFMIGDFAGIKYHLNLMGLHDKEHFWSTINLSKYCMGKYSDIKIRGEFTEKVVYSRFKAIHRQDDYILKDEKNVKADFIAWIKERAREAEAKDVVNIILITHGKPHKGLHVLGTDVMESEEILKYLKSFKEGVQVNLVSNACGSGALCKELSPEDRNNRLIITAAHISEPSHGSGQVGWVKNKSPSGRFRSSYFTDVIIKSLGKIKLDRLGPTMTELSTILEDGVKNKPIGDAQSTPQLAGSSSENAEVHLQKLLHLDYVDCPLDPTRAKRFLRKESDFAAMTKATPENVDEWGFGGFHGGDVKKFFEYELSKTKTQYLTMADQDLHTVMECAVNPELPGEHAQIPEILRAIALRAKIQSSFFTVFMFLEDQCLVSARGLQEPMELVTCADDEVRDVINALSSFELIQKLENNKFDFPTFFYASGYLQPSQWLATLIVRGAIVKDFWAIIDRISSFGEFGELDESILRKYWKENRPIKVNPEAGLVQRKPFGQSPILCFWLPYSMGPIINFQDLYRRFDVENFIPIEDLFFKYFSLPVSPSLPYEELPPSFIVNQMKDREF